MPTRLQDIAERVGVSVATVSRVVNGKAGVSERTRQAVLAELEAVGYDRPARAGRLTSGLVGLIVPELDNPVFPLFVREIERALAGHGYTPLLCTATPVVAENEYLDTLVDRGVAGLVLVAGRHANVEVDHRRYRELQSAGIPLVFVNGYMEDVAAAFVSSDDDESSRAAVEHLWSLGHRRIGCAMGPARYVASRRKVEGFRQALRTLRGRETAAGDGEVPDGPVVHAVYSVEGGRAAMDTLLDEGITGVLCGSDLMALGAVRAARARGLSIPQDVSVVGYDGTPLGAFADPPLTTLQQDVEGIGRHAVDALLDEIRGTPQPRREVLFPTQLVVRRSTGPAPADDGSAEAPRR